MSGMAKLDINEITAERMLDPVFAARVRAAVKETLEAEEYPPKVPPSSWEEEIKREEKV